MATTTPSPDIDQDILQRVGPLLDWGGNPPTGASCRHEAHGVDLDVHLTLPVTVDERLRQALVVRVLDALGASGHRYGEIDIHVAGNGH